MSVDHRVRVRGGTHARRAGQVPLARAVRAQVLLKRLVGLCVASRKDLLPTQAPKCGLSEQLPNETDASHHRQPVPTIVQVVDLYAGGARRVGISELNVPTAVSLHEAHVHLEGMLLHGLKSEIIHRDRREAELEVGVRQLVARSKTCDHIKVVGSADALPIEE